MAEYYDDDDLCETDSVEITDEDLDIVRNGALSDDDEDPYCICMEPNTLNMIACDGDKCEIQWYHFSCVGVDPMDIPEGKWYCKECTEKTAGKKKKAVSKKKNDNSTSAPVRKPLSETEKANTVTQESYTLAEALDESSAIYQHAVDTIYCGPTLQ